MDVMSVTERMRDKQQVAVISVVIDRLNELGWLTEEASALSRAQVVRRVIAVKPDVELGSRLGLSDAIRSSAAVTDKVAKALVKSARHAGHAGVEFIQSATKHVVTVTGPSCPECGAHTVLRTAAKTGTVFFACSTYKDSGCRGALDVVESK